MATTMNFDDLYDKIDAEIQKAMYESDDDFDEYEFTIDYTAPADIEKLEAFLNDLVIEYSETLDCDVEMEYNAFAEGVIVTLIPCE
jgi:hypothetical protein